MENYSGQQSRILDATAGKRLMWFHKQYPNAIYCDIRPEVEPDILCDDKFLPFIDKCFDIIIFDPPHCNSGPHSTMTGRYGHFLMADIRLLLAAAFVEFNRVLKDSGFLLFKWNSHTIKLPEVLKYTTEHFIPLFGQKIGEKSKHRSSTYWVTLFKRRR